MFQNQRHAESWKETLDDTKKGGTVCLEMLILKICIGKIGYRSKRFLKNDSYLYIII